jgi:AcrR family transcriptional regulator
VGSATVDQAISIFEVKDVTTPRGPYRSGIKRRREIIDAASLVFARYGYAGSSLRQIADDVGVTAAAFTRHFGNKEGLLQAVIEHWESKNEPFFEGAHGLEYFRRLPQFMVLHTAEPGLIELFLTLSTEATNPQHPAREWAVRRYERTVKMGIGYLREACALGQVQPMDDHQLEVESRSVYALMDGLQLQWLLDPALDAAGVFETQLEALIDRWSGAARHDLLTNGDGARAKAAAGEKGVRAR